MMHTKQSPPQSPTFSSPDTSSDNSRSDTRTSSARRHTSPRTSGSVAGVEASRVETQEKKAALSFAVPSFALRPPTPPIEATKDNRLSPLMALPELITALPGGTRLGNMVRREGAFAAKIKLFGPAVRRALGPAATRLQDFAKPVMQPVDTVDGLEHQPRPFSASILTGSQSQAPILMGPTRDLGTFGKIRDGLLMKESGQSPVEVVLKEWRTQPMRQTKRTEGGREVQKSPKNRLGRDRNSMMRGGYSAIAETVRRETELAKKLGGVVNVYGSRRVADKMYMILGAMDVSFFDADEVLGPLHEAKMLNRLDQSSFVRKIGVDIAAHLEQIHANGYLHLDGKQENIMLRLGDVRAAIIDFGGGLLVDAAGKVELKRIVGNVTHLSPELAVLTSITPAHDVWLLGAILLEMLAHQKFPPLFSTKVLRARGEDMTTLLKSHVKMNSTLEAYIDSVKRSKGAGSESLGPIDPERVRRGKGPLGQFFARAAATDFEVTAYVLEHLLHPDPTVRHSAAQAQAALKGLSDQSSGDPRAICAILATHFGRPTDVVRRLGEVAQFLNEPDIAAFGTP